MPESKGVTLGRSSGKYAEHCKHCGVSRTYHISDKCLWLSTQFTALRCPKCESPLLFDDNSIPLDLELMIYDDDDCGVCNTWLPA
jgi:hypothetical protein